MSSGSNPVSRRRAGEKKNFRTAREARRRGAATARRDRGRGQQEKQENREAAGAPAPRPRCRTTAPLPPPDTDVSLPPPASLLPDTTTAPPSSTTDTAADAGAGGDPGSDRHPGVVKKALLHSPARASLERVRRLPPRASHAGLPSPNPFHRGADVPEHHAHPAHRGSGHRHRHQAISTGRHLPDRKRR